MLAGHKRLELLVFVLGKIVSVKKRELAVRVDLTVEAPRALDRQRHGLYGRGPHRRGGGSGGEPPTATADTTKVSFLFARLGSTINNPCLAINVSSNIY